MDRGDALSKALTKIVIGVTLAGLCGLCTFRVVTDGGAYGLEYIFGGAPILAGCGLTLNGCWEFARAWRRSPKDTPDE